MREAAMAEMANRDAAVERARAGSAALPFEAAKQRAAMPLVTRADGVDCVATPSSFDAGSGDGGAGNPSCQEGATEE